MKKTGLKTFVFSFALTLFVVFSINGFCAREYNDTNEKYTPQKNISLFFAQKSETNYASNAPIRKIALSVLKEPEKPQEKNIALPVSNALDSTKHEIKIANAEKIEPDDTKPNTEKKIIVENYKSPSTLPPQGKDEHIILADKSDALKELLPEKYEKEETGFIPLERNDAPPLASIKTQIASNEKSNQVAMSEGDANVKNMAEKGIDTSTSEFDSPVPKEPEWKTMEETKPVADSPWVVAKGVKYPKNNMVLEQDYSKENENTEVLSGSKKISKKEETIASAEMVKNILIPIPKDIAEQDPLTPQLVVEDQKVGVTNNSTNNDAQQKIEKATEEEDKGFLDSLKNIFANSNDAKEDLGPSEFDGVDDGLYVKLKKNRTDDITVKKTSKILPTEMKLSFQPNRAEISGQTLKWIQAFASKVNEEQGLVLEVRIDSSSGTELQSRRLNLLNNILVNKGMDLRKVNTIFTAREPNSFVIRVVRMNENRNNLLVQKSKDKRTIPYYNQGRGATPDNYQQW